MPTTDFSTSITRMLPVTLPSLATRCLQAIQTLPTTSHYPILSQLHQPYTNHNGGQVAFGPDGYLYAGLGDGGAGGDPQENAQNLQIWLGKILRVDINGDDFPGDPARNYAVPPDNPFIGNPNAVDEIWAYGVRNPWRFSFDRETGDLLIGEVGQTDWEEIDFQPVASAGG